MASKSNKADSQTMGTLEQYKLEIAQELGIPLSKGYNGDLTSAQNCYIGGYMFEKMLKARETKTAGK